MLRLLRRWSVCGYVGVCALWAIPLTDWNFQAKSIRSWSRAIVPGRQECCDGNGFVLLSSNLLFRETLWV